MIKSWVLPTHKINILLQERIVLNNTVPELHFIVQRQARGMRKKFGKNIPQAQNILLHLSQLFVLDSAFFFF